jgi:hypothetical protein
MNTIQLLPIGYLTINYPIGLDSRVVFNLCGIVRNEVVEFQFQCLT